MRVVPNSLSYVNFLLEAARRHGGDDEPDHEVGDLQTFLVACWSVMSEDQRRLALDNHAVRDVLEGPEYVDGAEIDD